MRYFEFLGVKLIFGRKDSKIVYCYFENLYFINIYEILENK